VDLDGVLCDFESGVRSAFPELASDEGGFQLQRLERHEMWGRIASLDAPFFRNLPWARGGKELWNAVRHLRPDILTGVPASLATSRAEKYAWCVRELFHGPEGSSSGAGPALVEHVDMAGRFFRHARVNPRDPDFAAQAEAAEESGRRLRRRERLRQRVITCWSSNKHHESRPGAILIDDCLQLKEAWERKGGVFIHHQTGNVERTLRQLVEHGILDDSHLLKP
jgi:FMN phosphatase YigB (HAD superfamily)